MCITTLTFISSYNLHKLVTCLFTVSILKVILLVSLILDTRCSQADEAEEKSRSLCLRALQCSLTAFYHTVLVGAPGSCSLWPRSVTAASQRLKTDFNPDSPLPDMHSQPLFRGFILFHSLTASLNQVKEAILMYSRHPPPLTLHQECSQGIRYVDGGACCSPDVRFTCYICGSDWPHTVIFIRPLKTH